MLRSASALLSVTFAMTVVTTAPEAFAQSPPSLGTPAAASHVVPADGILDTDDLLEIADRARLIKVDQFTTNPADLFAGRTFIARVGGSASVSYDIPSKTFAASTPRWGELAWNLGERQVTKTGSYPGQNSYGVKAEISIIQAHEVKLLGQRVRENMDEVPQPNAVTYTAILEPDAARDLSRNLAWMVTGSLIIRARPMRDERGTVAVVQESIHLPEVSNPQEVHFTTTTLNAVIAKVILMDTRSGKLLMSYDVPQPER